ncbi:MAG: glycosyltransferase, partial [Nanoarchaeota archaeon]
MNICVLTHTYPRFLGDPVAPFMKDFCIGLSEQKQNVIILTPYDKLFSAEQNIRPNLKVKLYRYIFPDKLHTLGYSRTLIGDQRLKPSVFFLAPFMFASAFFSLLSLVYKEKIQMISAHWIVPNGFIGALISKITGVPLVITVPGSDVYLGKKNSLSRWMTTFSLSQAKVIVSNSIRYLQELQSLSVDKTKFVEIPYGINVDNFTHARKEKDAMRKHLKLSSSDLIILAVGRLVEKKG